MTRTTSTVTITSRSTRSLKPLIEAAIEREIDVVQLGIRRAEQRIRAFEQQHGMASGEFLRRHQHDELGETLNMIDWIGELQLLERLREHVTVLRELHVAD